MLKSYTVILGLTLGGAFALAPAKAADAYSPGGLKDVPFVSVSNWTGFYVGANGGYGWSDGNVMTDNNGHGTFVDLAPKGGFGGAQIGYNAQGGVFAPRAVLGIEADLQGAGIKDSATFPSGTREKATLDWFGTIRGRIGYAFETSLIYVTGGLAYGGVDNEVSWGVKSSGTATGLVIGGGYEFKLSPAWSVKAEYQFINLGKNEPLSPSGRPASTFSAVRAGDDAFHTLRVGLNYHPAAVYQPLK